MLFADLLSLHLVTFLMFFILVWIKLISPVLSGFQPPNSTQMLLQPSSTRTWLKPHPPINELAIVTALNQQLLAQTGINASPSEMGAVQGMRKRTVFTTRLCIGGQQWPTQSQPRRLQSKDEIELTYHIPSSGGFSAPKLHTNALTAILYMFMTQTTPTH